MDWISPRQRDREGCRHRVELKKKRLRPARAVEEINQRKNESEREKSEEKPFLYPTPSHSLGVETVNEKPKKKKNTRKNTKKNKQLCYSCKCILNVTVTKKKPLLRSPTPGPQSSSFRTQCKRGMTRTKTENNERKTKHTCANEFPMNSTSR